MVTNSTRLPEDAIFSSWGSVKGSCCSTVCSRASITVLPVTTMSSSVMASRRRFSLDVVVGARCRDVICEVILRLASSGNGENRLKERSPASAWITGIPR